jgi:hypothetical protein
MRAQTFGTKLWLSLLPKLVWLIAIPRFEVWLLRQLHRPPR